MRIFWRDGSLWCLRDDRYWRRIADLGWRGLCQYAKVPGRLGRRTWQIALGEVRFHAKQYRERGWKRWGGRLATSRAQREYENARRLEELGIPAIVPVGFFIPPFAQYKDGSLLLTHDVTGETINVHIESDTQAGASHATAVEQHRLTRELAKLVARLHESGVEHRDIHERNLMIRTRVAEGDRLVLLDLGELKFHRRLLWLAAVRDLRRLGRYFSIRTTRTDRLRFFVEYGRCRGWRPQEIRARAIQVERQTIESRAEFWRRRDCRPAHAGRDIVVRRRGNCELLAKSELPEPFLEAILREPVATLEARVCRRLKMDLVARVSEIRIGPGHDRFVWKAYAHHGWRGFLASLFRRDPATRAWCNARSLALREVPTPPPMMLVRRKRMGVPTESHLVTRFVDGQTMDQYLERLGSIDDETRRRKAIRDALAAAARLLRLAHDRRVTHHDLKASNLLACPTDDPGRPQLWLIDLDSVKTWLRPPERERVQNLARLAASFHRNAHLTRADRLRFLRIYLGRHGRRKKVWKTLWRRIADWVERKVTRSADSEMDPGRREVN